jgi:hypothetical protein
MRKRDRKDNLPDFTLIEYLEWVALGFLEKGIEQEEVKGDEDFGKFHILGIITLMATPYDKNTLYHLPKPPNPPLIDFFREAMSKYPDLTLGLMNELRKTVKRVDWTKFHLMTGKAQSMTDFDLSCLIMDEHGKMAPQATVTKARQRLEPIRLEWLRLRGKFAGKFCDPPPHGK